MTAVRDGAEDTASAVRLHDDDAQLEAQFADKAVPSRRPARIRPRWWPELLLIVIGDRIYEYTRNLVPTNRSAAEDRGRTLERVEDSLHINFGRALNHFVVEHEWLAQLMNYYYATLHFVVTVSLLIWLYARRPGYYRRFRTILAISTFVGLGGFFLYPLAPPRLLPEFGYIDTVVIYKTWGSWADPTIAEHSNQYAAMPSLHTAWALWCALVIVVVARRTWVKALGVAYPIATITVIVGTANHFVLDAVGGAAVFVVALLIEREVRRWRDRRELDRWTDEQDAVIRQRESAELEA